MDDKTRRVNRGDEFPGSGEDLRGRSDETTRNYAATTGAGATSARESDELDPETKRRTREIQSEIANTRAEMSETIDALQEKLRPANLVSDATDKMKTATAEKVKNMADTASETAQDVARETRDRMYDVVEGAKQNPVPALMIGAGVAWLLMDRSRNKGGNGSSRRIERSEYSNAAGPGYQGGDYDRAFGAIYGEAAYAGQGHTSSGSVASRSADALHDARDTAQRTARRTQSQLQRMLRENPLLVGAAAVLVGAAVGASLPETDRENEIMGEARDSIVDRAQEAARDAATTVREVAGEAVGKVTEKVGDTGTQQR
jgi:ElaB/YqjD/DUF883 family membrane-anchored ribosome-binding protein